MAKKFGKKALMWIAIAVLFVLALFLVIKVASLGGSPAAASSAASSASSAAQSASAMVGSC